MTRPLPSALAELLREVGADPASARLGWAVPDRNGRSDYLVLPSPARAQVLAPCAPGGATLVAERRSRRPIAALARRAVVTALGSRFATRVPLPVLRLGDPALEDLAQWVTGVPGHRVGVLVGPQRANRKPVLRILGADGSTWGFAKMGINPLTNGLVRHEAAALARVADLGLVRLRAPKVLKAGVWRDREILATSPLAIAADQRQPLELPVEPTRELFSRHAEFDVPLRACGALAVTSRPETGSAGSSQARRVEELAERMVDAVGETRVPLGAAHGDWTPWNMAWSGATLEAWDWERYATGVPQGLDVVHFAASRVLSEHPERRQQEFLGDLPGQLAACGVDPALTRHVLATYLVVVGRRYAADLAQHPARRLALRLDWVLGLLTGEVATLEAEIKR